MNRAIMYISVLKSRFGEKEYFLNKKIAACVDYARNHNCAVNRKTDVYIDYIGPRQIKIGKAGLKAGVRARDDKNLTRAVSCNIAGGHVTASVLSIGPFNGGKRQAKYLIKDGTVLPKGFRCIEAFWYM